MTRSANAAATVSAIRPKKGAAPKGTISTAATDPTHSAPTHLEPATAAWFNAVIADYALEPHHVRLLVLAAESWDRAQQARSQLAAEGITYTDRFGSPRKHPAVSVEENARTAFARLIRELDLEGEPLPPPRPPRRGGR